MCPLLSDLCTGVTPCTYPIGVDSLLLVRHCYNSQHQVDQVERPKENNDNKEQDVQWTHRSDNLTKHGKEETTCIFTQNDQQWDLFIQFSLVYYLVISVFPEVQSDQLEWGQHSPTKMVEACVAKVGVLSYIRKAGVSARAFTERKDINHLTCSERSHWIHIWGEWSLIKFTMLNKCRSNSLPWCWGIATNQVFSFFILVPISWKLKIMKINNNFIMQQNHKAKKHFYNCCCVSLIFCA